jgi:hypothetical protein
VDTTRRSGLPGRLVSTAWARNVPNTAPTTAVTTDSPTLLANAARYCGSVTAATTLASVGLPAGSDSAPLITKYSGPPRNTSRYAAKGATPSRARPRPAARGGAGSVSVPGASSSSVMSRASRRRARPRLRDGLLGGVRLGLGGELRLALHRG